MSHLGNRLTALVDGCLDVHEQDKVMAHVRHCSECRDALEHEQSVRRRLHQLPGAEPSAALLMALKDIGSDPAAVPPLLEDSPSAHWRLPSRRRAGLALAGAGTAAVGVLGLAYMVGPQPAAEPVRPPVEQFSSEFAGVGDPPFSDPAVDAITVFDSDGNLVSRR